MKTAILFDLDGTLLDTLGDLHSAVNYVLRLYGYPERTLAEIRRFVGNGAENLLRQAVPTEGQKKIPEILAAFQKHYAAHCNELTAPYAGIPEALLQVGQKYPMAVVSNKPDRAVKELAEVYFPALYARGESADCPRKPAPDMLYQAMQALGAENCIYVGDSEVDVVTSKNANVPCLSVTWGFRDLDVLEQAGASCFCHSVAELAQCIDNLVEREIINGK